ncbi:uncharacterized protein BDZ99DRAFT_235093 [Mytilinidion resinicola]|uniref:Uncharacterized protein n=1 Tax=Mytilinidion resinicola TaxID=574789 RepID=A0A6A6YZF2_9PEZI|nr:uncharacterized protein BDZ99DRAFT_235093 [Mytilinidion resinicola]KAF2814306.1 hypothetical protein BDZ99DRAFT_235093 [Mytilinidion resinicola]
MAPQIYWSQDHRLRDADQPSIPTPATPGIADPRPTAADLNSRIDQCAVKQADMKTRITKLGPATGKSESDKAVLDAISKFGSNSLTPSDIGVSNVSGDMSDADIAEMSGKLDGVEFEIQRLEVLLTDIEKEWKESEDLLRSGPKPPEQAKDGDWGLDGMK